MRVGHFKQTANNFFESLILVVAHTRFIQTDAVAPLAGVAFKGLLDIAALLVSAGAEVDAASADGRTPLSMAAAFNRGPMVAWLLQHGASRDARDA